MDSLPTRKTSEIEEEIHKTIKPIIQIFPKKLSD